MDLNLGARVYIALVAVAAIALLAVAAASGPLPSGGDAVLWAVLVAQALLLVHFPVLISPRFKVDATPAIYFAGLLLLGPAAGMATAGLSRLGGELLLTARSTRRGRRMATPESAVFNTSQLVLATGAAGLVLRAVDPGWTPSTTWGSLAAVGIAAGSFYAVSELAVAAMVGIQTGRRPHVVLLSAVRLDALENATLLVAGFLVALAVQDRPWLALLLTLPAALAFVSLTKTTQLLEQTVDAVAALADVVDRRDPYTFEHSRRVAANAVRVATRMRLSAREVDVIGMAARVHDLGKIGLPDAVLLKHGPLTEEEFALMKKHPEMGVEILTRFPRFRRGRDLVLHHHERPDGRGYPAGLRAGEIPLGAQIIAAADAFDAMTSARPYRSAMGCEAAVAELRRGRGTQWSAAVVDVLVTLVDEGRAEAERRPAPSSAPVPQAAA